MKINVSKQRIVPKSDNTHFNLLLFVYIMTKVNKKQFLVYKIFPVDGTYSKKLCNGWNWHRRWKGYTRCIICNHNIKNIFRPVRFLTHYWKLQLVLVLFQKFIWYYIIWIFDDGIISLPPDVLSQLGSSQFPGVDSL